MGSCLSANNSRVSRVGKAKPQEPAPNLTECATKIASHIEAYNTEIDGYDQQLAAFNEENGDDPASKETFNQIQEKKKRCEKKRASLIRSQRSLNRKQNGSCSDEVRESYKTLSKKIKTTNTDEIVDQLVISDEIQDQMGRSIGIPETGEDVLKAELNELLAKNPDETTEVPVPNIPAEADKLTNEDQLEDSKETHDVMVWLYEQIVTYSNALKPACEVPEDQTLHDEDTSHPDETSREPIIAPTGASRTDSVTSEEFQKKPQIAD